MSCCTKLINILIILIMKSDEVDTLDLKVLEILDPPQSFPPSSTDLLSELEAHFYRQCENFLDSQKKFYNCSKKVEKKLEASLSETSQFYEKLRKDSNKLNSLRKEVDRINKNAQEIAQRQKILGELCEVLKMESARGILLQSKIKDEEEYLRTLKQLDETVQTMRNLESDATVIRQLREELSFLLEETVTKLIKGNLSQSLIEKIIGEYSSPFLRDPKVAVVFKQNLKNNRLNHFRLGLNPLVNNINYANNVAELYEKIVEEWIRMIEEQMLLFYRKDVVQQIQQISREVLAVLILEIIPRLERNIYKVKDIVDISKIRFELFRLKKELGKVSSMDWDPLPKVLVKTYILLEEKLEQEGEQLQIAKYNIYSLASYLPIREHLQKIKRSKQFEIDGSNIEWERAFNKLASSRSYEKQLKNKSLLIFNINIWYLYGSIIQKGNFSGKPQSIIKNCSEAFANCNLEIVKKEYCSSKNFVKLLDFCIDLSTPKKLLFSEISLLIHDKLRKQMEEKLKHQLIDEIYAPMLVSLNIEESGLEKEKVIARAQQEKINLNKYGKLIENIRIYSPQEVKDYFY